jgi:hypothetical protein
MVVYSPIAGQCVIFGRLCLPDEREECEQGIRTFFIRVIGVVSPVFRYGQLAENGRLSG